MKKTQPQKPNFIFILIDDLGWKDLSCYGSNFYETPNIDRLASEGVRFTDAYAAAPVCSPSRASILTGKYPANVGITDWIDWQEKIHPAKGKLIDAPYVKYLPLEEKTIANVLKDTGYNTWHVGKWHLGDEPYHPDKHGFDINIGGCKFGNPCDGYFSPWNIPTLKNGPNGEYLTDRLTNEAIELIKNKNGKPFFLNLWYYCVHTPIQAKEEHIEKYTAKAKKMGLDKFEPFEQGDYFPCEHKKDQRIMRRVVQSDAVYAAMIENLDNNLGRLFEVLKKTNQTDNTVIIFTSDNGGLATTEKSPTCNSPLAEGKGWMYEGGIREPLLIKWPGITRSGSKCEVPVSSPDFYPTLLEMAMLAPIPEQHCDGVSIVSLLKGNNNLDREAIYWHYPHYGNQGGTPGSVIRMGNYKLIEFFEDGHIELYNIREDISEKRNLANEKPELAIKMKSMLVEWRKKVKAKIPPPNPTHIPWRQ